MAAFFAGVSTLSISQNLNPKYSSLFIFSNMQQIAKKRVYVVEKIECFY